MSLCRLTDLSSIPCFFNQWEVGHLIEFEGRQQTGYSEVSDGLYYGYSMSVILYYWKIKLDGNNKAVHVTMQEQFSIRYVTVCIVGHLKVLPSSYIFAPCTNRYELASCVQDQIHQRSFTSQQIVSIACSPCGVYCAAGSNKGTIFIWESASGKLLKYWNAHYKVSNLRPFPEDVSRKGQFKPPFQATSHFVWEPNSFSDITLTKIHVQFVDSISPNLNTKYRNN